MTDYVYFNGKKLRKGYTTGTCAAAAATAAALYLLKAEKAEMVQVETPQTKILQIPLHAIERQGEKVVAAVCKDSGDDADVTNGMLIYASLSLADTSEIEISGGLGIGRVTQPGLQVPVGEAAINPVPRKMITENVRRVIGANQGVKIEIFAPEGERLAQQTMNGRLGIVGGISILGTTGIVTPMSEEGWKSAISVELEMKRQQGYEEIILCPGNYGEAFATGELQLNPEKIVCMSNFVGYVLKEVQRLAFKRVLMVGHIGKFIKIAAGIFSTHSKDADARSEIMVANLALMGMPKPALLAVEECLTTESAGVIIEAAGYSGVYQILVDKIQKRSAQLLQHKEPHVTIEVVLFSSSQGFLAATKPLNQIMEEWSC